MTLFESQKKPTFQWDEYRRQVLCCLYRFFREDNKVFEQIFSEFFKAHLLERGFPKGAMAYRVLHAQWTWMRRTNHGVWKYVHLETDFITDREWKDTVHIIKAVANRLGVFLSEKCLEDDHAYRKRVANEPDDSNVLLSTEDAVDQIIEELTSISPLIEPRSPESTWTPSRRPHDLPFRPTPETPTPSSVHLPTKSRYWSRDEAARHEDQTDARTPVSMSQGTNVLGNPVLNELADSEEPEYSEAAAPCQGTLWGLPCFWCHKDGSVKLDDEQHMSMEAAVIGSSVQLTDDSPHLPLAMEEHPQLLDEQRLNEQLPDDSKLANSTVLPGLCTPDDLPPVLYRWSNVHSQGINSPTRIVAGMFAGFNSIPFPPAELDEESFLGYVKSHVTKAPVSSPFISAFKSLLAPIHRGLRNGQGAMISVVDTSQVPAEIFKAVPLVEITKTALRNWRGYGEYLVWGEVPASAIACTFTISTLEEIASDHPDIGEFLQLEFIRKRDHCTRFLYGDLAANMPPSQDGFAEILDRLTGLLGMRGNIKDLVAREFKQTWSERFLGQKWEEPEDRDPTLSEPEPQQELELDPSSVQVFSVHRARQMSTNSSDGPWQPSNGESEDDSGSSSSGSGNSEASEEAMKCPRHDTPSEDYSVCDDSSDDDWRRRSPVFDEDAVVDGEAVVDEDVEMAEGDWDSENEWPSDEGMPDAVPIHWVT